MASNPHTSPSQKKAPAEGQTPIPEAFPATGVLEQTAEPEDFCWGDTIALQVWLACSLLLWLIGLCSVCAGLSK